MDPGFRREANIVNAAKIAAILVYAPRDEADRR
jgi:hypothetical protein